MPIISIQLSMILRGVALVLLFITQTVMANELGAPVISFQQAWFNDSQHDTPPPPYLASWRQVYLPDNWYRSHRKDASPAWYRLQFDIADATETWGIYLSAVNTNAEVWLNGEYIGNGGSMHDPAARNWYRPLYFTVPKNHLLYGSNSLFIQLLPKKSGFGFLGQVYIGPDVLLRPVYEHRMLLKQTVTGASTLLLLSIGAFTSLIWFKRRKESLYGWFAAGCFSWAFFVFDMYAQHIPVQERLWDTLVFSAVGWLVIFMTIFFYRFWNIHYPRYERFLISFGLIGTTILYLVGDKYFYFVSSYIWDNLLIIFSTYMTWFIITQCLKWPSKEAWLLAIALGLVVSFGGHDNLVQMGILEVDSIRLLPYGAPFFLGVVVWMLVNRFVTALDEKEQLNYELDRRVQTKSLELEEYYTHIKKIEREKILAEERERIMRDMHDGTGGLLVAALAQVEKGNINKSVLSEILQNALDDIRLMIDSLDPVDEDIVAVLAMFRSRMEARLHYSGIRIVWNIKDVPVIPELGPERVLQLTHILYEAVTNIIKHANADTITFRTGITTEENNHKNIFIEIEDNGTGLGTDIEEGNGIANMYYRAATISARLEISNTENGAVVRILLPLSYSTIEP
jgi:signal transduction histidine kinase